MRLPEMVLCAEQGAIALAVGLSEGLYEECFQGIAGKHREASGLSMGFCRRSSKPVETSYEKNR